jgi:hypothetical protein
MVVGAEEFMHPAGRAVSAVRSPEAGKENIALIHEADGRLGALPVGFGDLLSVGPALH